MIHDKNGDRLKTYNKDNSSSNKNSNVDTKQDSRNSKDLTKSATLMRTFCVHIVRKAI